MRYIYYNVGKIQNLRALCNQCYKLVNIKTVPEYIYYESCPKCKGKKCLSINNLGGDETAFYKVLCSTSLTKCECGSNTFYFTDISLGNTYRRTFPAICSKCGKIKEKLE